MLVAGKSPARFFAWSESWEGAISWRLSSGKGVAIAKKARRALSGVSMAMRESTEAKLDE